MKVLIGTAEISGIASSLRRGFESIDVDADTFFSARHPFEYDRGEEYPAVVRVWQWTKERSAATRSTNPLIGNLLLRLHQLVGLGVLALAISRYDACVFLYGTSITGLAIELRLWRFFGKPVVFVYVGSDTRPPYINGVHFPPGESPDPDHIRKLSAAVKRRVRRQEQYATCCVNSPFTAQFHEKPYISWFAMGLPRDTGTAPENSPDGGYAIRILHAPSRPEAKGTDLIRGAIGNLKAKGYDIDYVEISNQPNAVVIDELRKCDFIVDQAYSDTPLAGFAAEAASLGKPAVVGGYAATTFGTTVKQEFTPPSLFVQPEDLEAAIEKLISDSALRDELGRKAQHFVSSEWSSSAVASRYLRLLEGDIPASWWCSPGDVDYVSGAAVPQDRSRALVARLIASYGTGALQIADKPELQDAFIEFASPELGSNDQCSRERAD